MLPAERPMSPHSVCSTPETITCATRVGAETCRTTATGDCVRPQKASPASVVVANLAVVHCSELCVAVELACCDLAVHNPVVPSLHAAHLQ